MKFRTMYNIIIIISALPWYKKMLLYSYEEDIRQKILIFAGIALKLENIESQSMSIVAIGNNTWQETVSMPMNNSLKQWNWTNIIL